MPTKSRKFLFHILALLIVVIWGTTFVSTKVLLQTGLNPQEIFFYRFSLAYLLLLAYSHKKFRPDSLKDELKMMLAGICGGSLYFYTENTALEYTATTNIALILCIAPLLTAFLLQTLFNSLKRQFNQRFISGSLLALAGVSLVILNGHFVLELSPAGDLLCLAAALSWAFYTVILKDLENRYESIFVTRKVFFYGWLTILPLYLSSEKITSLSFFSQSIVWGNLLYLGVVASLLCFLFWTLVLKNINPIVATNYIYFSPVVTATASFLVLGEKITWLMALGAVMILLGVYIAGKNHKTPIIQKGETKQKVSKQPGSFLNRS